MSKAKTRLGLIGLCVTAAMALMAFAASGAQASSWMVEGTTVTSNLNIVPEVKVEGSLLLLTTFGKNNPLWIECEEVKIEKETTLHANGTATGGEVSFSECTTYLEEGGEMVVSEVCKPKEPIVAGGTLEVVESAEVIAYTESGPFTTVTLGEEEECSAGEEFEVTGTAAFKDCENKASAEHENLSHLLSDGLLSALLFGTHSATVDGSAFVDIYDGGKMVLWSVLG